MALSKKSGLRIVFMGTPEFACVALKTLLSSYHEVVAVYSQPPRPAGRGHCLQKSPVHQCAEQAGLPIFTPLRFSEPDALSNFQALNADIVLVAAYGLILPGTILETPRYGCLNIHASLLPRWRGAAPIQRAIMAGDTTTGVTIMQMDTGLDTGDMLLKGTVPITSSTTAPLLHDDLARLGATLMLEALEKVRSESLSPEVQPTEGVTYAEKISKEEGLLDWRESDFVLDRRVRALNPWPGTYFLREGKRYRVMEVDVIPCDQVSSPPGTVLDHHLTIQCGQGALRLKRLQRPGKSVVEAHDFLNGTRIDVGTLISDSL